MITEDGNGAAERRLEIAGDLTSGGGTAQFAFDAIVGQVDWAEMRPGVYSLMIGGESRQVSVRQTTAGGAEANYEVSVGTQRLRIALQDSRARRRTSPGGLHGSQEVLAPMPGRVVKILAAENGMVKAGDGLLVIEAMKMQNELRAPRAGRIGKIYVREGQGVETGARLTVLV